MKDKQEYKCITAFHSIDGVTDKGTIIPSSRYWRLSLIERRFFRNNDDERKTNNNQMSQT